MWKKEVQFRSEANNITTSNNNNNNQINARREARERGVIKYNVAVVNFKISYQSQIVRAHKQHTKWVCLNEIDFRFQIL